MSIWNPNTPANGDELLSVSAPKIKSNFNVIGNTYGTDHVPLGTSTNFGYHNQSTYATQSTVPTADPNDIRLFSQLVGTIPQIFAQYPVSSGITKLLQITNLTVANIITYNPRPSCTVTEISFTIGGITFFLDSIFTPPAGVPMFLTYGGPTTPTPFATTLIDLGALSPNSSIVWAISGPGVNGFTYTNNSSPITIASNNVLSWGY